MIATRDKTKNMQDGKINPVPDRGQPGTIKLKPNRGTGARIILVSGTGEDFQSFFQGRAGYVGDGTKVLDDDFNWVDPPETFIDIP